MGFVHIFQHDLQLRPIEDKNWKSNENIEFNNKSYKISVILQQKKKQKKNKKKKLKIRGVSLVGH